MTRRHDKRDLEEELREARQEHRQVVRQGRDREPMLQRLERDLRENGFIERLVASIESSRRRPT